MWRFKVLPVPLDFSDANLCPLNSGPLDLNRLKIIDDILNRLKCQNVKCQKHITEEPKRKHFISMPRTVVSSKFGVNFITITNVILLVIYIIIAASLDLTSQKLYRTTIIWFSPWLLHVCQQGQPRSYMAVCWQYLAVCWSDWGSHHNWCAIVGCAPIEWKYNFLKKHKNFLNYYQNLISCLQYRTSVSL